MCKKILAVVFALMMVLAFAAGCGDKEGSSSKKTSSKKNSSKKTTSVSSVIDDNESSGLAWAEDPNDDWDDDDWGWDDEENWGWDDEDDPDDADPDEEEYAKYKWPVQIKENYFRDSADAKVSASKSEGIKNFTDPHNVQIASYHLSMTWTDSYGKDFESRKQEFQDVVEARFFNAYFLPVDQYLMTEVEIVAKNGGVFWLGASKSFRSERDDIDTYIANLKVYVDMLYEAGYGDLFQGFHWDEPVWSGMPNNDFLLMCERLYKAFGKRLYPVFATGEYTNFEGNSQQIGMEGEEMQKVYTFACKYLTDVGFDSYSYDVRTESEGGWGNGSQIEKVQRTWPGIVDGKTYYITMKEELQKHVGHPVNFWYFPCGYETYTWGGRTADESYCLAQLNFMAEDLLKEEYPGGLHIYTFPIFQDDRTDYGFEGHMNIKDSNGNYLIHYGNKWETYSERVKEIRALFDSRKANYPTFNFG